MSGYESPITIYETAYEDSWKTDFVLNTVKKVGINVEKDELIRALKFDRDQYYKGYNEAKLEHETPSEYWFFDDGYIRCTCCKRKCPYQDYDDGLILTDYCGFSGKKMHKKGYDKFEILDFDDERVHRYDY